METLWKGIGQENLEGQDRCLKDNKELFSYCCIQVRNLLEKRLHDLNLNLINRDSKTGSHENSS